MNGRRSQRRTAHLEATEGRTIVAAWLGRSLSLLIAVGYVAAIIIVGMSKWVVPLVAALLVPLALIWFPRRIGSASNYRVNRQHIDQSTPPILIALAGWFFLIVLPLVVWWNWRS